MKQILKPLHALYLAQFLSAFSDNMILFIIIEIIKRQGMPAADIPYVQAGLLIPYVVFAAFVGPFADKNAKSTVLWIANVIKALGILVLMLGSQANLSTLVVSYLVIGIGAVVYSPGKYGILPELTKSPEELLGANSKIEGTTIFAIIGGAVVGGILAVHALALSIVVCLVLYLIAVLVTFLIPKQKGNSDIRYLPAAKRFLSDTKKIFTHPKTSFSVMGTGSFWMASLVLRTALVLWVPLHLHISSTDTISEITGLTAIGIMIGALVTPKIIPIQKYHRAVYFGFGMVAVILLFPFVFNTYIAIALLLLVGFLGGAYVVPLNTSLQETGNPMIGAGNTIAVQNLVENFLMLVGVGAYGLATNQGVSVDASMSGAGIVLLGFVLVLTGKMRALRQHA